MRKKWVCRQGADGTFQMIDIAQYVSSGNSSAAIHQDTIDPTWHPSNGKYYDSKSRFREVTKLSGGQEIGNDYTNSRGEITVNPNPYREESIRDSIIKAYKGEVRRG